jgi:hypothetical protein
VRRVLAATGRRLRTTGTLARGALLGLALFAAYASTLGLDAFGESDYGGDEPHHLLAAQSLTSDGDLDVLDEYEGREYASFYPYPLDMHGEPRDGGLNEPHGAGFPVLIAPAFALGGAIAVELLLAAIAAACGVIAYLLALRVVRDPWALGAALAVGLSPPLLAYGSAVYPELAAGCALAGAALLALRLDERPGRPTALALAGLLAAVPWLGLKFVPAAAVIGLFAARALARRSPRLLAAGALVVGASGTAFAVVSQALYGGPTPYAADFEGESPTEASFPLGYLERSYRLAALLVDRDYGVLRWAPVLALALVGAWLLLRRGTAAPERGARTAAQLFGAALLAQLLVAAFLAPTMFGFWFPGRHLLAALPLAVPLVALGARRLPRVTVALAAIGIAASIWLAAAVRLGDAGLAADLPDAPWGPLDALFPFYGSSALPYALTAVAAAVALALVYADRARAAARQAFQIAGVTRRRYSG